MAQDECHVCLQVLQAKSQSLPVDDIPQGQIALLLFFFFLLSDEQLVNLSEKGDRVVANGLTGLPTLEPGLKHRFWEEFDVTRGLMLRVAGLDV